MGEKGMRFKYYANSQMIVDTLTDERISGNQKTCDLLNKLDKRANENAEKYFDALKKNLEVEQVLEKYGIISIKKLDQVLFNQKVW
jgi:hypothetical protein